MLKTLNVVQTNHSPESQRKVLHYKDEGLNILAETANVAQFVSFDEKLNQRFSRIHGFSPNFNFNTPEESVAVLIDQSTEKSVNIRSYRPESPESNPFIKNIRDAKTVVEHLDRLSAEGLFTIVNELIDEKDGGVSGVAVGGIIEFAPDVIPRGVDDPSVESVSLPREIGIEFLKTVYGFSPDLEYEPTLRVEFSIHPLKRGYRGAHTTVWELRNVGQTASTTSVRWPNDFSRRIGDKAFGLLAAYLFGLPVPYTTVIPRWCAPFSFGRSTKSGEVWFRTCPREPVPGFYTTTYGWTDPYKLLAAEDPEGTAIASVLSQESVDAVYSGALLSDMDGNVIIEGVEGKGDSFMLGESKIVELPKKVETSVRKLYDNARSRLGPVRMEWVYDGTRTWVVQLHIGATATTGSVIHPGEALKFHRFNVENGLENLRKLLAKIKGTGEGIILVGNIGVSSHLGDELRKAQVPSKIERT